MTATDRYNLQITYRAPVHKDYTGPERIDFGSLSSVAELRQAYDRYCDAV